jgi:cellulose biosynthesis protein BcsE
MSAASAPVPPARSQGLARARRWVRQALFADACHASLPMSGLPPGIGTIPARGAALLLCADIETRERLLATIAGQLDDAGPALGVTWLCAAAKAPLFMEDELGDALRAGCLRVLTWSEEAAAQVRALGPLHLLRELHASGMRRDDLLIVDLIEPWMAELAEGAALEGAIAQALDCLAQWCQDHEGPVLALLPTHRRGTALLPILGRSKVPRVASLRVHGASAELEVLRWSGARAPGAPGLGLRCALHIPARGPWQQHAAQPFEVRPVLAAADAPVVHALHGVLHDAAATPPGWQTHASLEALVAAAGRAVAATVVLEFDRPDSLPALAGVVGRLRRAHPGLLRILVRETGATLRRNGELALTRIGANAILRRELGFAQVEEAIEALREECYTRPPVADAARLLQRLAPDPVQGRLAPAAFCHAVERMLERTADTPLEHTLAHLPLMAHVAREDALQACLPRRDGDLVSADERGLYVFFFGCPADDAMAALDSIFALPCSELVRHVQLDDDPHTQRRVLAELRRQAEPAGAPRAAPAQPVALPTRPGKPMRGVQAHELPLRSAAH